MPRRELSLLTTVDPMASPILLCTDGSEAALEALSVGLELLGRDHELIIVTVADTPDDASLVGSGHAGPEMSLEEYEAKVGSSRETASAAIAQARSRLSLPDVAARIVEGDPGPEICWLAGELEAKAVVVGSRGRGGLKRFILGSVSDYVSRKAPCSVIVTRS